MSDDEEYEYDYGSDGYDYDSDGGGDAEGGDEAEDELVEIENAFYGINIISLNIIIIN
jgi:hypothetical protein